jgi:hypothetical protein
VHACATPILLSCGDLKQKQGANAITAGMERSIFFARTHPRNLSSTRPVIIAELLLILFMTMPVKGAGCSRIRVPHLHPAVSQRTINLSRRENYLLHASVVASVLPIRGVGQLSKNGASEIGPHRITGRVELGGQGNYPSKGTDPPDVSRGTRTLVGDPNPIEIIVCIREK